MAFTLNGDLLMMPNRNRVSPFQMELNDEYGETRFLLVKNWKQHTRPSLA
jgi:hypothetical protein